MSAPAEGFYSEERWQNWLDRLEEESVDPEDEDSARLLLNLQDDVAIAVAKVVKAYEDDLDAEVAMGELAEIREIVLAEVDGIDEETGMLLDTIQVSLLAVFASAERFLTEGPATDESVDALLRTAAEAEADESIDRALELAAAAGTRVIDGDELEIGIAEELDYGYVVEWINGLDSLQTALSGPEVVEDAEGA